MLRVVQEGGFTSVSIGFNCILALMQPENSCRFGDPGSGNRSALTKQRSSYYSLYMLHSPVLKCRKRTLKFTSKGLMISIKLKTPVQWNINPEKLIFLPQTNSFHETLIEIISQPGPFFQNTKQKVMNKICCLIEKII